MLLLTTSDITTTAWILALTAAFVIGISKAGIKGIAIINVTLMALAFGAKESTGWLSPYWYWRCLCGYLLQQTRPMEIYNCFFALDDFGNFDRHGHWKRFAGDHL